MFSSRAGLIQSSQCPFAQLLKATRQVLCKLETNYGSWAKTYSLETAPRLLALLAQRTSQTLRTPQFLIQVALGPNTDTPAPGHPRQLGSKRRLGCQQQVERLGEVHPATRCDQSAQRGAGQMTIITIIIALPASQTPGDPLYVVSFTHGSELCNCLHFTAKDSTAWGV